MYFSVKGTPMATITLIAYVVIICLLPVFSGEQQKSMNPLNSGRTTPSCPRVNVKVESTRARSAIVKWTLTRRTSQIEYFAVRYKKYRSRACWWSYKNPQYVPRPNVTSEQMITTINGLQPYTKYGIEVAAKCAEVELLYSDEVFVYTHPSAPPRLNSSVGRVTSNSILLEWGKLTCNRANGRFKNYTVVINDGDRQSHTVSRTAVTTSSEQFTSLVACTRYTLSVRATNEGAWINGMRISNFQGPTSILTSTTQATVSYAEIYSKESTSLYVRWEVPLKCQDIDVGYTLIYELYRLKACVHAAPPPSPNGALTRHTNSNSFEMTDLEPFAEYRIWISVTGGSDGPYHLTNSTLPSDPAPVGNLESNENITHFRFSWSAPRCQDIHGSLLRYDYSFVRDYDSNIEDHGSVQKGKERQKSYRINYLKACTSYTFSVQVVTGTSRNLKKSNWTLAKKQTPTKAPGKPTNITVYQPSRSVSVATVSWEAPADSPCPADQYNVTYELLYKDMCNKSSELTSNMSAKHQTRKNITGLFPHSLYRICVYGLNGRVPGEPECKNFTTEIKEPSKSPKRVKLSDSSYYSLTFAWDRPKCGYRNGPIDRYDYSLNTPNTDVSVDGNVTPNDNGGNVTCNDLIPGTTYYFKVRAVNGKLYGNYSRARQDNTSLAVYPPPRNINVTTLTETTAMVEWNIPQLSDFTTTGYRIKYWESNPQTNRSILISCVIDSCRRAGVMNKTITGLRPATNHSAQVVALYKYGEMESNIMVFKTPEEVVGSTSPASGKDTMIPVVAVIFVIIIVLLFVVASQLYSRKTNKQLFKWPELFSFSLPGIFNSMRRTDTSTRVSAQAPNNHTTRDVNGDGMEMNVTCDVNQSGNHACNSEMESDLSPAIYENVTSQTRKHTAIPVGQFLGYVARKNAGGFGSFDADFKSLPSNDLHSQDIASQESNKEKNRFKNILPYDHSRVKLSVLNDDPSSDYINASFIDGYRKPKKYIAGQGPNTASMDDFWRMVWQYNSRKIVMLTNLREANKKKCEKYWPDRSVTFGGIVVTMAKEEIHDHYSVRYFNLVCNNTGRDVIQYHYTTWPDMGVPEYSAHLMSFLKITRQTSGPAIVHCSAGVGRTGTFLALDAMLDQVEAEQAVDIHSFIANMRQKRPLMVQTKKQYRFIYEALVQELTCGDTSIEQNVFTETYHSLLSKKKGTTVMQQQYELLEALTVNLQDEEVAAARTKENAGKNRFQDKVPAGRTRPFLMTAVEGSTDYINASFLPGCVSRNQYIGAQTPLPNTVADFWRLVVDYKVNTIVMLHGNSRDKTYAQYWNKEESTQYGSFKVQVIKEEYNRPIMFRTMEVTDTDSKKASSRTVKQFQLASCPPKSEVPPMADVMQLYKALISDAGSTDWKEGNSPLLIHCRDGEGITGAFCAFMSVMDHLNTKQTIDVFHACKRLRTSRPGAVATLAQYQFIYEAVKSYLMSTSIYENMAKIV